MRAGQFPFIKLFMDLNPRGQTHPRNRIDTLRSESQITLRTMATDGRTTLMQYQY